MDCCGSAWWVPDDRHRRFDPGCAGRDVVGAAARCRMASRVRRTASRARGRSGRWRARCALRPRGRARCAQTGDSDAQERLDGYRRRGFGEDHRPRVARGAGAGVGRASATGVGRQRHRRRSTADRRRAGLDRRHRPQRRDEPVRCVRPPFEAHGAGGRRPSGGSRPVAAASGRAPPPWRPRRGDRVGALRVRRRRRRVVLRCRTPCGSWIRAADLIDEVGSLLGARRARRSWLWRQALEVAAGVAQLAHAPLPAVSAAGGGR